MKTPITYDLTRSLIVLAALLNSASGEEHGLLLSDEAVPWQDIGKDFLKRPAPVTETIEDLIFKTNRERKLIIEKQNATGEDLNPPQRKSIFGSSLFLSPGNISPGFVTPTGAVWQPTVIIYGTYRAAIQSFSNGMPNANSTEFANRFDLFTNIYLTPTERIFFSMRPLDVNGKFTSYRFDSPTSPKGPKAGGFNDGYYSALNGNIRSLYFEGDFGELFPNLDPTDTKSLDYGFAVGRMPLNFQDGIMINDSIDAIGVTRASMFLFGASASRLTALVGWNELNRGNNAGPLNVEADHSTLFGLFYAADYEKSTFEFDLAYVNADQANGGDGAYLGIGQTRRYGKLNTTIRANFSQAFDDSNAAVDNGTLLFGQISRTMDYNFDIAYMNAFWGIDNYTSASRDPTTGGPIGGINGQLFGAVGLGTYGAALSNQSNSAVGGSIGYQHFLDGQFSKRQLTAEIGGRVSTDGVSRSGGGIGIGYQQAIDQHSIIRLEGFLAAYDDHTEGAGVRCEWSFQF